MDKMIQTSSNNFKIPMLIFLWLLLGIAGRLLPHLPNSTPLLSLSLLSGIIFSRKMALLLISISLLVSDFILSHLNHYPTFGSWTMFTYMGFVIITLMGSRLLTNTIKPQSILLYTSISSFGFWLWTNLDVLLFWNLYPLTWEGFLSCYIAALPFLRNELCGSIIWMFILLMTLKLVGINKTWLTIEKLRLKKKSFYNPCRGEG